MCLLRAAAIEARAHSVRAAGECSTSVPGSSESFPSRDTSRIRVVSVAVRGLPRGLRSHVSLSQDFTGADPALCFLPGLHRDLALSAAHGLVLIRARTCTGPGGRGGRGDDNV